MEKWCKAGEATDDDIARRMRFACWISKATDTHSEYVILIAFTLQQWLHERSLLLRSYVHCLSCFESKPGICLCETWLYLTFWFLAIIFRDGHIQFCSTIDFERSKMKCVQYCLLVNNYGRLMVWNWNFFYPGLSWAYLVRISEDGCSQCLRNVGAFLPGCTMSRYKVIIYTTLIKPVLMYGAETWVLSKADELRLGVFERKILRRVYGPICEGAIWRSRYSKTCLKRNLKGPEHFFR